MSAQPSSPQTRFTDQTVLTPAQREKEQALFRTIWLDAIIFILLIIAAISSGSLTIMAEIPRGGLLFAVEVISVITLCRSHRGKFSEFAYGIGKIERVISILIAAGLFLSALYTLDATLSRLSHPVILPTPAMILGVMVASYNLTINFYCVGRFMQANEAESSLILDSQIRSRLVKTVASAVVVLVLVIATWLSDPKAATLIDAFGALFVVGYMVVIGVQLLRESLPDLLDRALPEREQLLLMGVITAHYENYANLGSIKSRRSGGRAFIDIDLEFEADMPFNEVTDHCINIENDVVEKIPDAVVSVKPQVENLR